MCFRQNQIWTVIPQQFEAATNKKTEGVSINISEQNAMYIKMVGE
jgi:hypothetical protein